jgi:uncharacterized membrane protein
MSANIGGTPLTRSPRLVRKAEVFLADRLEPGETALSALRVRTGSLLIATVVTLVGIVLLYWVLDTSFGGQSQSGSFDAVMFVGYVAIIFGGTLMQKPRLLVLTDSRLFVLRTTPILDRVVGIEAEERREVVQATLVSKDRVLVSGSAHRAIRLRLPWGSQRMAQYLRDWATPVRPDG